MSAAPSLGQVKVPPQNVEAEENVIGSMLMSQRAVEGCSEILGPTGEAFYRQQHQLVYRACLALYGAALPIDVVSVIDFLERNGKLADAGGRSRLHELAALVPAASSAPHWAKIVVEQGRRRTLLRAAMQLQAGAEEIEDAGALLASFEETLAEVRSQVEGSDEKIVTAFEAATYLDERIKNPQEVTEGIPTPLSFLPRMQGGRMYVLAGYQADGKTGFMADLNKSAVAQDGVRAGIVSLEMGWEDVAVRLGANAGAPAKQVETGHVREGDRQAVAAAIAKVATMRTTIIDAPFATVADIRRWQRRFRFDVLFVDHLHQFAISDPRFERQELERIIRGIVGIAREFNIPVVLLAQLSRTGDIKNPYPRPTMASLRGSAMIEALAWCVWFVWRKRDKKNLATHEAEFIVAKNRSGRTGAHDLTFHDRLVRFTEVRSEGV